MDETRVRTVTARPEVVLEPLQVTAAHRPPCQMYVREEGCRTLDRCSPHGRVVSVGCRS